MKKTVKAWAVVPTHALQGGWPYGTQLLFNDILKQFSHAVFTHEEFADKYARGLSRGGEKSATVPCTITYQIPTPPKRKKGV